jgi:hypothetical protein
MLDFLILFVVLILAIAGLAYWYLKPFLINAKYAPPSTHSELEDLEIPAKATPAKGGQPPRRTQGPSASR